jgi:peroxiredoxin
MRKVILIIFIVCALTMGVPAQDNNSEKAASKKFSELLRAEKYEEALKLVDKAIKTYDEKAKWYRAKYYALARMGRYKQAAAAITKKETLQKTTNSRECMDIARTFFKMKDIEGTIRWLDAAAQNGFNDYPFLENKEYLPLRRHWQFAKILEKMKENCGIGKPAKAFTTPLLTGGKFTLSQFKGKVVLVDFWSTKCGPCLKEIPSMRKAYERLKDKGYEIIGISLNYEKETLTGFLKKEKMPWLLAFSGKGWDDDTKNLYNIFSIPSTWLVDKKGTLRYFGLRGEELTEAVEKLIAE